MRYELEQILALQPFWTSANSDEMKIRGHLIRRDLPDSMRARVESRRHRLPARFADVAVQGRDATGLKSHIPWVRVFSQSRSPKATEGWYLVYLFAGDGSAAYLSLNQGTTTWSGGEFRAHPQPQLKARSAWARSALSAVGNDLGALEEQIDLRSKTSLGPSYEAGNVVSMKYATSEMPAESALEADLDFMLDLLLALYDLEESALSIPGEAPPEVVDAKRFADIAAGRSGLGGARLRPEERKAIEQRAVRKAIDYLLLAGYLVEDVSATESYDLDAILGNERLYVEVKGTVSGGEEVILTRSEVALHAREYPGNMLAIVSRINLDRTTDPPTASGGDLRVIAPWLIDSEHLTPLSYSYVVPNQL